MIQNRHTLEVLEEVAGERAFQDTRWGGEENDDNYTPSDWVALCVRYLGRTTGIRCLFDKREVFRRRMLQLAALAVAAVEWCDRQDKKEGDAC